MQYTVIMGSMEVLVARILHKKCHHQPIATSGYGFFPIAHHLAWSYNNFILEFKILTTSKMYRGKTKKYL